MGAGASQQYAAPYGADPYFGDASDPWRRRQGYPPPASYPGATTWPEDLTDNFADYANMDWGSGSCKRMADA